MMDYRRINFDQAATTPVDPRVIEAMERTQRRLQGNPSAVHADGVEAALAVEKARALIAAKINADPDEIYFTSGGTESNNLALKGAALIRPGGHVLVSAIEHPSVLGAADWLDSAGIAKTSRLPVNGAGQVEASSLSERLGPETRIVSVMQANNETGVLQPLTELGRICRERGVLFHADACQGFLREKIDVRAQNIDLLSLNAHKIHGPKGVGALFVRKGVKLMPLFHGGGHERDLRAGTLNVPGIVGFAEAVRAYVPAEVDRLRGFSERLWTLLREGIPDVRLHGLEVARVPNILSVAIPQFAERELYGVLQELGYTVAMSSACSSRSLTPSHVLTKMGVDPGICHRTLRLSFGRFTSSEEITGLGEAIVKIVQAKIRPREVVH